MKPTNTPRPYFKFKDIFIILFVLLIGIGGFVLLSTQSSGEMPYEAQIRVNNRIYKTIELSNIKEPYEIKVEGDIEVTLEISSKGVRFKESECPDKLCIHSGLISSGQSAACLPAGVSVKVSGNSQNAVDAVAG